MGNEILYEDPARQAKLEEAIRLGFILRQTDPDGVLRYSLTNRGMCQWAIEKGWNFA